MVSEYLPSPREFVAEHVRRYEASGGAERGDLNGFPCVIVTHTGRRTGGTRKTPLIRVKDGEHYVLVASMGGAPQHPQWFHNVLANPDVTLQDREAVLPMRARLVDDAEEKARLWKAATAVYADYDAYQERTERSIPLFVLEPR